MQSKFLKTSLYLLIGDRTTIRRGSYSGIISGFFVTILVGLYFAFVEFNIDVSQLTSQQFDFWAWYVGACISIGFIVMGGRSIGWLLIRPIASVLSMQFPHLEHSAIWAISNVLVWLPMVILVTQPYQYPHPLWKWLLFLLVLVLTIISGIIGGILGARANTEPEKDSRDLVATGGSVTASLTIVLFQLIGSTSVPNAAFNQTSFAEGILAFCGYISVFAFLCSIPFMLIA